MSELQIGDTVQTGMISVTLRKLQTENRVKTGIKSLKLSKLQIGDKVQTTQNQECKKCLSYK